MNRGKGHVAFHYGTEFLELQTLFVKKFAQYMASHIKPESLPKHLLSAVMS